LLYDFADLSLYDLGGLLRLDLGGIPLYDAPADKSWFDDGKVPLRRRGSPGRYRPASGASPTSSRCAGAASSSSCTNTTCASPAMHRTA